MELQFILSLTSSCLQAPQDGCLSMPPLLPLHPGIPTTQVAARPSHGKEASLLLSPSAPKRKSGHAHAQQSPNQVTPNSLSFTPNPVMECALAQRLQPTHRVLSCGRVTPLTLARAPHFHFALSSKSNLAGPEETCYLPLYQKTTQSPLANM